MNSPDRLVVSNGESIEAERVDMNFRLLDTIPDFHWVNDATPLQDTPRLRHELRQAYERLHRLFEEGDLHSCPIPGHGTTEIVSGSPSHVEGQPVARVGDKTGCGATIIQGSSSSHHDGRPTAYLGCKTDHGGEIISASSSANVEP